MDQPRLRARLGRLMLALPAAERRPLNDHTTPGTSSPRRRRRSGPTASRRGHLIIIGTLLVAAGWEIFRLLLDVLTLD
jgi:hypothetical protein